MGNKPILIRSSQSDSVVSLDRFPIPEGCHILIVPTQPFWFSKIFSQTIGNLGLKFGEYLGIKIVSNAMPLEELKVSDL